MTEPTGMRQPSAGRTPMDVPVVTAEVADGAITPPDMAYVVDQLQKTSGEDAGRVRRARARLFGPDPSGVSFAEYTSRTDEWGCGKSEARHVPHHGDRTRRIGVCGRAVPVGTTLA